MLSSTKTAAVVLAVALAVIMRTGVAAQWYPTPYFTTFAPANDVSFTITTDRASYGSDDPITLKYEIVNVGGRPLFVPLKREMLCPPKFHVDAWLESADGHYGSGENRGASCGPVQQSVTQRMNKGAVLLKPGDHTEGTLSFTAKGLPPGEYRTEAVLYGWRPEDFSPPEQAELAKFGSPFLRGEIPASGRITLTR
jgi:hypothetical protein